MSRFVRPQTKTLVLSQPPGQAFPDTLVVRCRLSWGEERAIFTRMYRAGATRDEQLATYGRSRLLAYLLDWSVLDDEGQKVSIADRPLEELEQILDALTPDDAREILTALDAHVAQMDAEREAEKNGQGGGKPSPAISPSPSAAAGAMTGSATSTLM